MPRKPRLTLAEARYFCEVDCDIRRGGYSSGRDLEQAFSDRHDSGLYRREIDGLIRKRLLRIVPLLPDQEYDIGLMGYSFTVDMTDRAMRIFWPKLFARRQAHAV